MKILSWSNTIKLLAVKLLPVLCLMWSINAQSKPAVETDSSLVVDKSYHKKNRDTIVSRKDYFNRLYGFWLGESIANWTGLVTEIDKIGGKRSHGQFYTREDWGKPDQPSIWGKGIPSSLSSTIDWVFEDKNGLWGADDDTDIEYMYQHLLTVNKTSILTGEQIRDGWLKHIYSDDNTPFINKDGEKENYLWVSNQRAHDLMRTQHMIPPYTSLPKNNPDYQMIDAQLTTEIFGSFFRLPDQTSR